MNSRNWRWCGWTFISAGHRLTGKLIFSLEFIHGYDSGKSSACMAGLVLGESRPLLGGFRRRSSPGDFGGFYEMADILSGFWPTPDGPVWRKLRQLADIHPKDRLQGEFD
jgi:hypothetical protein